MDNSYKISTGEVNNVCIYLNQTEWIKISDEGFWVRGIKVEQDEKEARIVYEAFREFLMWSTITKLY